MSGDDVVLGAILELLGAADLFTATVNSMLERTLEDATAEPLGLSQVKVLRLIGRSPHRYRLADVAALMGVTNAAASRTIERLVQRGLIDRTISAEDRRAVNLALTPDGQELVDRFTAARDAGLLERLGRYAPAELQRLARLLDEVSARLVEDDGEGGDSCLRCGVHFRTACVLREVLGRECASTDAQYPASRA